MLRRDDAICDEIVDEVLGHTLRMTPGGVTVTVQEGFVTLSGRVGERSTVPIAQELRELFMTRLIPAGSAAVYVHVSDGTVHLNGTIPDPSLSDVLVQVARTVPGVVDVTARLDAEVPVRTVRDTG
ncbi:BON domain-containing protein [Streptomyces sp. NPDC018000]|uniref:BON domain-containing protein n=1 Tax=Streptomyces sp. NPDC018000 TaxID=3365028 RepID=UPI0037BBC23D